MTPEEAEDIIIRHLSTIPEGSRVDVAFFGGSFTGIPVEKQKSLLEIANKYLKSSKITGIRLSTRPDYISNEILDILKRYGVTSVELGVQSMDDEVLKRNERGHTSESVYKAVRILKDYNFEIGLQMMTGMYGSTFEKDIETGEKIASLSPATVRIYPTIVLENTKLAEFYRNGDYVPPPLEDTINVSSKLYKLFDDKNIRVIRMGLQSTDNISEKGNIVAGPYHSSFGELVLSRLMRDKLEEKAKHASGTLIINSEPCMVSKIVGNKRENIRYIKEKYNVDIVLKINKEL